MSDDRPSRAAAVLDDLARRSSAAAGDRSALIPRLVGRLAPAGRIRVASVVIAVVVVATAVALVALGPGRRPPPIEERLPMAGSSVAAGAHETDAAPTASTSTNGAAGADGPTGAEADGTRADGTRADGTRADGTRADGTRADENAAEVTVHVAGAVSAPGVVELDGGARIVDAVAATGGLAADADTERINLAAPVSDGQWILVPRIGQSLPATVVGADPGSGGSAEGGAPGAEGGAPIDINTASAEQLEELPGVGPATAAAIVDHRESSGPFRSVESLVDVRGIGEAKLDAVRDLVTVGGA